MDAQGSVALGGASALSGAPAYRGAESRLWSHFGAHPSERRIEIASLRTFVRVQETGAGSPVLFIHGGPNAGSTFAPLAARLRGRRCLILDRPGCGLSGPVDYRDRPIPELAAETVRATLDGLGVSEVDIVGSSFGGAWAIWSALADTSRVRRLVLLGVPAFVPGMAIPAFMRMMLTPVLGGLIAKMPPSVGGTQWVYRQIGHGAEAIRARIPRVYWEWAVRLSADTPTMANDSRAIHASLTLAGPRAGIGFTREQLASIAVPTLLYWGDADAFGGAALARATAALIPESTLEVVPSAGHLPWLDEPGRASASVSAFLDAAA
jgi:pimeloyl-ACP methyl ester carboxylesterase